MIGMFAAGLALMVGAMPQKVDTTLAVARGTQLRVETRAGSVVIDTWTRDAVRVAADGPAGSVDVHYGGGDVAVETEGRGGSAEVDYRITVPKWMKMHVETQSADVTIHGAGGEVMAESTEGSIHVRGGERFVQLSTVSGAIEVSDSHARVHAETVNEGITLRNVTGDVDVESVNGDVTLDGVDSGNVQGTTVNGAVSFHGKIRPSGYYHLSSHNGQVGVFVASPPDATVSVTAFNGSFDTDFPLRLTSTAEGRHMTFTSGSGAARMELDSFNGAVVLGRTGGPHDRR